MKEFEDIIASDEIQRYLTQAAECGTSKEEALGSLLECLNAAWPHEEIECKGSTDSKQSDKDDLLSILLWEQLLKIDNLPEEAINHAKQVIRVYQARLNLK